MATKFGKLVTCHEGLPPIILLHPSVMWSCEITWQTKSISPPPQYLWPYLVTYLDCLLAIKSNDQIITWFCEITWQTKNCISTTTMLMTTKCGRMMTYLEWLLPIKSRDHIITWSNNVTWKTEIIVYPLTMSGCLLGRWGYTMRSSFL